MVKGVMLSLLFSGCHMGAKKAAPNPVPEIPELVVYCENGMAAPIYELARQFEMRYACKVHIHNDNARNLLHTISNSSDGDLFIPDSEYGLDLLRQATPELLGTSLYLGSNRLIAMVPKNNPEAFQGKLSELADPRFALILANPESSSLGFHTRELLMQAGIYPEVIQNTMTLAADNRGLVRSIQRGEATLTIDWLSSYYYNSNQNYVDTVSLQGLYPEAHVYAALLAKPAHPGLAHTFLALLSSAETTELLSHHGLIRKRQVIQTQREIPGNDSNPKNLENLRD